MRRLFPKLSAAQHAAGIRPDAVWTELFLLLFLLAFEFRDLLFGHFLKLPLEIGVARIAWQ